MKTIEISDLSPRDKRQALLAIGQRWTFLLLELGGNPRALPHQTDVSLLATAVQPLCHPMLSLERIADLMFLLSVDVSALDRYESELTWEGEQSVLTAMTHEERVDFLRSGVDRQVFCLLNAIEPCVTCMHTRDYADWQPQSNARLHIAPYRCLEHGTEEDEVWRQRRLHDGARLVAERDFDTFGGR